MRNILFRGKSKGTNEWVYGSLISIGEYYCILELDCQTGGATYLDADLGYIDGQATPVIPQTIGRMIDYACYDAECRCVLFEGDIIKLHGKHGQNRGVAIVCDEHSISENGLGRCFPQDTVQADVIGNVWDNPELVGEKIADLYLYYYGFQTDSRN